MAMRFIYLAMLTVALLSACVPPYSQTTPPDPAPAHSTYEVGERTIHYAAAGDPQNPLVLVIHGTPGSWHAFRRYLEHPDLLEEAYLVAVDRPGFGRSAAAGLVPSIEKQSELLAPMLLRGKSAGAIVVGHSLGGTIAYRMAIDHPEDIDSLIIVSASISPEVGGPRWYNYLVAWTPISYLLGNGLRRANKEIMPLERELERMAPALTTIDMGVTVIHGKQDRLVSAKNADFAESRLQRADLRVVRSDGHGHFLLWEDPEIVVDAIVERLD